jgi:hypothetical protein
MPCIQKGFTKLLKGFSFRQVQFGFPPKTMLISCHTYYEDFG